MNPAERRIRAYEALGDHRSGRAADNAATDWLIAELAALGVTAEPQQWTFPQVDWSEASIAAGGAVVEGVPLFDGALRGASGLLGSEIAVAQLPAGDQTTFNPAMYPYLDSLAESGARAVVLVMGDPDGGPVLRNAERPLEPIALPVLQVAPNDAPPLLEALEQGLPAELRIQGARHPATADNVIAALPGRDPDAAPNADPAAAPVVLMTPKSGWYACAAERGGGIAVWLEVAGRLAARPGRRPLQLVASSGHELHHLGLDHYLNQLGPDADRVHAWMHLGASIGARNGSPRYAASDATLHALATDALNAQAIEREPFPVGATGYGEARNIGELGGRFVSLLGGHPYFHSPSDTYDRCVDPDLLQRHSNAVEQIVRALLD